jgi:hypothetical protein
MNYNIENFDVKKFKKDISKGLEFELSFPLSSIGYSSSRIDIIQDYAQVSFCCERIVQYIKIIESGLVIRDKYYTDFKILCTATDVESLTNDLLYFSKMLSGELSEYDDIDRISFFDEISDFESSFHKQIFTFPDLINNYWANLINGAYWEIASEYYESESKFFNQTYKKFPEHRYMFWKSPQTKTFKDPIYFSTENWIIPPKTNLIEALKVYSGLEHDLIIEDADKIDFNNLTILVNSFTAVYFNQKEQLIHSIKCTERVLSKIDNKTEVKKNIRIDNEEIQINIFGERSYQRKRRLKNRHTDSIQIDETKIKFQLSEFGDVIIVEYESFYYIFFSNDILTFEQIKELNTHLYPVYSKTLDLINISISEKCNWVELNDDTFEELCYDILFCHPLFDSSTIQKMGKSRSRDGGRDIVIKTKKTPTKEQELYIFQCKYFSESKSLSASKISNAGNVIMQYGAKGYGVFTTTVIDSTLYDMLEGFKRNIKIDTSLCWSKYELERYLNRHQMIKNKYFKK